MMGLSLPLVMMAQEEDLLDTTFLKDDPIIMALDELWMGPILDAHSIETDTAALNIYGFAADSVPRYSDSVYAERLAALDAQTPFDLVYNDRVRAFIELYAVKRREQAQRLLGLQHVYFPMMESVLDQYDMPYELKYLAVVESALNPKARSGAGAVGLWQFMYATGKMYDLHQNSYFDERMDPIKSTHAACQYLNYLYGIYGKWDLALAAYNCGPGNVNRAMRRSGSKDGNYWDLYPYLPRETRGYVPAFIAVNYWMNYPSEHNLYPVEPLVTHYETDTIRLKEPMSFELISERLGVSVETLRYFNPTYRRDFVPVYTDKQSVLTLPREYAGVFIHNEDTLYAQAKEIREESNDGGEIKSFTEDRVYYRVRSGDYLGRIANQHHVSVSQIKAWNGLRSNNIRVGQRLVIYPNGNYSSSASSKSSTPKPIQTTTSGKYIYYEIKSGDTLWDIARARGTSVNELKRLNANLASNNLKPGTKIIVGVAGS